MQVSGSVFECLQLLEMTRLQDLTSQRWSSGLSWTDTNVKTSLDQGSKRNGDSREDKKTEEERKEADVLLYR